MLTRRRLIALCAASALAPCFVGNGEDAAARTDTVLLACTHYPLLMHRLVALAPWPVDWIDPAPAIARRVVDLIGTPGDIFDGTGAEMIPKCLDSRLAALGRHRVVDHDIAVLVRETTGWLPPAHRA